MKKLAIISLVLASSVVFAGKPTTYKGWVTDAACGVKGTNSGHVACAVKCLKGGGTYVLILDKDKKTTYTIDNPKAVKGHEGHLVSVAGTIKGTKIHVTKVTMLKQPPVPKTAAKADM
jgi:hypothetical protein